MNKLILGSSIFFILLALYVYKKKEYFQGNHNHGKTTQINSLNSSGSSSMNRGQRGQSSTSQSVSSGGNNSTLNIPLNDSNNKYENNPLLLLPPPSGGGGNTDKYDMSKQKDTKSEDGKQTMINVYINPMGKIHFKRSEIEQVFGDQLSKFNKKNKDKWEQEEYGIAKLMVPLTWKAMANQYGQFKQLIEDVEKIKKELNSANVTMVKIEQEAQQLKK